MIETDTQQDTLRLLFNNLGGTIGSGFPAIHSAPRRTPAGTPYLTAPGVVMLAKPEVNLSGLRPFLEGFDPNLKFGAYADDPTSLDPGAQLVKVAGQTCYASFGETRTMNVDAARYIGNISPEGSLSEGWASCVDPARVSTLLSLTADRQRRICLHGGCSAGSRQPCDYNAHLCPCSTRSGRTSSPDDARDSSGGTVNANAVPCGFAALGNDSDRILSLDQKTTRQRAVWRRWGVMVTVRLKTAAFEAVLARRNLTKTEFARLTGLHRTHLSDLLAGRTNPGPETRRRLLTVLEVEFDAIFEIIDKKPE